MCWVSRLGYLRFVPSLAAAFELDIQIHCYSWNGKESVVEHIISSNYYAAVHHVIQQRKVHHNPAKVSIHSQRPTLLKRQAEKFESLKPARRAQGESARTLLKSSESKPGLTNKQNSPHAQCLTVPPRSPTPLATSVCGRIFFHFCLTTVYNPRWMTDWNETSERIVLEIRMGDHKDKYGDVIQICWNIDCSKISLNGL